LRSADVRHLRCRYSAPALRNRQAAGLWLKRGEREGLERSTLKQYRNHVDTAPAAGQAMTTADVILEAVCLNCDRGLTLEEIAELPDFDDDEFDEVVENIDELVTIGAIVQRDDGDPDDDFELRYYPSPEGVAAWLNPSDEN